jgi:hypothetical protein
MQENAKKRLEIMVRQLYKENEELKKKKPFIFR